MLAMDIADTQIEIRTLHEELRVAEDDVVKLEAVALRGQQGPGIFRSAPLPGAFAFEMHQEARRLLSWVRFRGAQAVVVHDAMEKRIAEPEIGLAELRGRLGMARELVELLEEHDVLRLRAEEAFAKVDRQLGGKARREREAGGVVVNQGFAPGTPEAVLALAPPLERPPWHRSRRALGLLWRGLRAGGRLLRPTRLGAPLTLVAAALMMVHAAALYEDTARVQVVAGRLQAMERRVDVSELTSRVRAMDRKLDRLRSRRNENAAGALCDQSIESIAKNVELLSRLADGEAPAAPTPEHWR